MIDNKMSAPPTVQIVIPTSIFLNPMRRDEPMMASAIPMTKRYETFFIIILDCLKRFYFDQFLLIFFINKFSYSTERRSNSRKIFSGTSINSACNVARVIISGISFAAIVACSKVSY